ncbi:MAG: nuclear transport factor 2 family protein, partial [Myxococcota bacterium]
TDLRVEYSGIEADDQGGKAHWEAWYTFGATGRKVHNIIDATFAFREGKISRHQDTFGFYRWSRQALGAPGILLGWTPVIRNKVQSTAAKQLHRFLERS